MKATVAPARPSVVTVTETGTRLDHFVTDNEMDSNIGSGRYTTVCGAVILPASLTQPSTGLCQDCQRQWWGK